MKRLADRIANLEAKRKPIHDEPLITAEMTINALRLMYDDEREATELMTMLENGTYSPPERELKQSMGNPAEWLERYSATCR